MKSGWTRLVRTAAAMLALAGGLWAQDAGAAEIKIVKVEYAWPWWAEIRYDVVGTLDATVRLVVTATDRANNASYTAQASALSGDTGSQAGAHKVLWELDKQGIKLQSTNVVFTVKYEPLYCVVDLSGGTKASSYPVTYLDEAPSGGFNTDAYKTTKLVLRRIPATNPFYAGIFEVTQKQWTLVEGSNPSSFSGDTRPVEQVSFNDLQGGCFLSKLRAKTGLEFALPTQAQWEYACRAGTTTKFSYGDIENGDYMWYYKNSWVGPYYVGTREPNPWGLYDMHGNVSEICQDGRACGGNYTFSADSCTSTSAYFPSPRDRADCRGFRLFGTLSK